MTIAELLKRHPLPWTETVEEEFNEPAVMDANGVIVPGYLIPVSWTLACWNAVGHLPNPEGVGKVLTIFQDILKALEFPRGLSILHNSFLHKRMIAALAALHTAPEPEPGEETAP